MQFNLKTQWHNSFALLQRLGQALMVPVSVLPAAGLMVAAGRILTDFTKNDQSTMFHLGKIFYSSGLVVFEQLSLIFAVGVALGFTGYAGIAGLAAVTGYFAFTTVLKNYTDMMHMTTAINTGVLGGICVGFMVASLYNRYHQVRLHPVLGFFSGKRLIPILAVFSSVVLALFFAIVWPPIQNGIHAFGESVMGSPFGPSIYASVKRLLIPVGLHHVFYPSFLYEFGEFVTSSGQTVRGEATRYFAGDPTAGRFMASEFPMMIFGLPAAAYAMVLRAKPEKRKAIAGVMLSAALTSIITGITEPIEFAFTFVAPLLYLLHACLAFLSGYLTNLFDIHLGYTFSSSLIDLVLGYFNQKNVLYMFVVVGPIMAILYFSVFYWAIGFFNFKTPGREDDTTSDDEGEVVATGNDALASKAAAVLDAVGGSENIQGLDACITRLRLMLKDDSKVNAATLKKWGASGVMNAGGGSVQIVFGVESDFLKQEIQKIMNGEKAKPKTAPYVMAPLAGRVLALSDIPDETFAKEILGKTIAVMPSAHQVVAPFDGTVTTLFRTQHAIGLTSKEGVELLIHVGIDTVKMNGEGFKAKVKEGDAIKLGQVLLEFDPKAIEKSIGQNAAKSLVTPFVITNADSFSNFKNQAAAGKTIQAGELLWK